MKAWNRKRKPKGWTKGKWKKSDCFFPLPFKEFFGVEPIEKFSITIKDKEQEIGIFRLSDFVKKRSDK